MASVRACCSPLLYLLVSLTGPDLFGRVLVYVSAAQIRHMRSVGNVQILLDQDERFERRRWRSFRRRCQGHNGFVESISKLTIGNLQISREPFECLGTFAFAQYWNVFELYRSSTRRGRQIAPIRRRSMARTW
jgi:GT2 family glycosyltransferase